MKEYLWTRIAMGIYILVLANCQTQSDQPSQAQEERAPNIIIIFADDLGYGDLGTYGHPTIRTPNLDRLSAEGMKFTQFYSAASVCTPSRAALLTGRLPLRSGMCSNERWVLFPDSEGGLPQDEITIAEALKEKDYATACIGKWHLGHLPRHLPPNHGFDYYFGIPYSNDMDAGLNDWDGAKNFPATPLIENLEEIEMGTDQTIITRRYTEKAVQFIEKNKDQPFFLYFPHTFPHIPLYASDKFLGESTRGLYGDVVEEIDWSVGEILKALKENQLDQNTLVFFTSDNGPWLSQNQEGGSAGLLRDGKGSTWEGGVREPAIAWWPGVIPSGSVTQAITSTMDLFPTCLKLAGAELPQDKVLDGLDLMPLFSQPSQQIREYLYYYQFTQPYAVRKGPFKAHFTTHTSYIGEDPVDHEPPLLFNLDVDPSEKYNIAPDHPGIVNELIAEGIRHRNEIDLPPSQLESLISK